MREEYKVSKDDIAGIVEDWVAEDWEDEVFDLNVGETKIIDLEAVASRINKSYPGFKGSVMSSLKRAYRERLGSTGDLFDDEPLKGKLVGTKLYIHHPFTGAYRGPETDMDYEGAPSRSLPSKWRQYRAYRDSIESAAEAQGTKVPDWMY